MTLFFRFYLFCTGIAVIAAFLHPIFLLAGLAVALVLGLVLMLMPQAFVFGLVAALGYLWYRS